MSKKAVETKTMEANAVETKPVETQASEDKQVDDESSKSSEGSVRRGAPRTGTVQRCFHRSTKSNGMTKRVTVFYEYNRDKQVLKYGAVLTPKCKHGNKKVNTKESEEAAKKRFQRDPVVKRGFKDTTLSVKDFEDSIRKLLYKNGCKAHPVHHEPTEPTKETQTPAA
jgi:hypothetical protein